MQFTFNPQTKAYELLINKPTKGVLLRKSAAQDFQPFIPNDALITVSLLNTKTLENSVYYNLSYADLKKVLFVTHNAGNYSTFLENNYNNYIPVSLLGQSVFNDDFNLKISIALPIDILDNMAKQDQDLTNPEILAASGFSHYEPYIKNHYSKHFDLLDVQHVQDFNDAKPLTVLKTNSAFVQTKAFEDVIFEKQDVQVSLMGKTIAYPADVFDFPNQPNVWEGNKKYVHIQTYDAELVFKQATDVLMVDYK